MKAIARVGAVLALAAGGATLAAGPASAAQAPTAAPALAAAPWDDNCKNVPATEIANNRMNVYPSQVQGADVSMYQKYGISGINWFTYDLGMNNIAGCLPNGAAWAADINTMIANFTMWGAKEVVTLDSVVLRRAYTSDWMGIFDPFVTRAVTSLHDAIFDPWSAVALAVLGLIIAAKAYRGSLTDAVTRAGAALLVITAALLIFSQPVYVLHTADDTVDHTTQRITSAITGQTTTDGTAPLPADAMISAIHKEILYRVWLEGTFGNADSATAQAYGARIFGDMTTTYAEAKTDGDGKGTLANLIKAKQGDFKKAAAEIAEKDPVAYGYLQGQHSEDRPTLAFRATVAAIAASPVIVIGSFFMMVSKLMVLAALAFSMLVLLAAIIRGGIGLDLLDRVLSGLTTTLIWAAALPISMLLTDAALNNPKVDAVTSLLLIIAINGAVFWLAKTTAPGFGGIIRRKHRKKAYRWSKMAWQYFAGFLGARSGAAAPPPHQPQHAAGDVVDAEVLPDEAGHHRDDDDVYGEDWTREPVDTQEAPPALPGAPISPDDVETEAERDGRTLPERKAAVPEPEPEPEPGDDLSPAPHRREGGTDLYDIYSGKQAPPADTSEMPDDIRELEAGPSADVNATDKDA